MKPDRSYLAGGGLLLCAAFVALSAIFQSCSRPDDTVGRGLYTTHCSSCHGATGQGLRDLYPPLQGSIYLDRKVNEAPCIITKGITGSIVTSDGSRNQRMPAFQELTTAELTPLLIFLLDRWGRDTIPISPGIVEKWLRSCQ